MKKLSIFWGRRNGKTLAAQQTKSELSRVAYCFICDGVHDETRHNARTPDPKETVRGFRALLAWIRRTIWLRKLRRALIKGTGSRKPKGIAQAVHCFVCEGIHNEQKHNKILRMARRRHPYTEKRLREYPFIGRRFFDPMRGFFVVKRAWLLTSYTENVEPHISTNIKVQIGTSYGDFILFAYEIAPEVWREEQPLQKRRGIAGLFSRKAAKHSKIGEIKVKIAVEGLDKFTESIKAASAALQEYREVISKIPEEQLAEMESQYKHFLSTFSGQPIVLPKIRRMTAKVKPIRVSGRTWIRYAGWKLRKAIMAAMLFWYCDECSSGDSRFHWITTRRFRRKISIAGHPVAWNACQDKQALECMGKADILQGVRGDKIFPIVDELHAYPPAPLIRLEVLPADATAKVSAGEGIPVDAEDLKDEDNVEDEITMILKAEKKWPYGPWR